MVKQSSMEGNGYAVVSRLGFTVDLLPPHKRIDPSDLTTGTIGEAYSE